MQDHEPDWLPLPNHVIEFRGICGVVTLVAEAVLSKRVADGGIVSFSASYADFSNDELFGAKTTFADYSGLGRFARELAEFISGKRDNASILSHAFSLVLSRRPGLRDRFWLTGEIGPTGGDSHWRAHFNFEWVIADSCTPAERTLAQVNHLVEIIRSMGYTVDNSTAAVQDTRANDSPTFAPYPSWHSGDPPPKGYGRGWA